MKTEIYLERKSKVIFDVVTPAAPNASRLTATLLKNLESLGFTLSDELIDCLMASSEVAIVDFYTRIVPVLRKMKGSHVAYRPMYPNFPTQVMEMAESDLYLNATMHYYLGLLPEYEIDIRPKMRDKSQITIIDAGTQKDFEAIFTNLVAANSSISETDKDVVRWFVTSYNDAIKPLLPAAVPSKEQVGLLASLLLQHTSFGADVIGTFVKTATDTLRLAVAISNGDVSLAIKPKFGKFTRKERKLLLSLLEGIGDPLEDMARWKGYWLRLGEKLHPGEYKTQYVKAFHAFHELRNEKVQTFNGKVEVALMESLTDAVNLLTTRPGDMARRLNQLFTQATSKQESADIHSAFVKVMDKVSTPVLLQLQTYFANREDMQERMVFPKGAVAKALMIPAPVALDYSVTNQIASDVTTTLVERFKTRETMGKVFLDPKLSGYLVPFSQRSASKALRTLVRGSRVDLPDSNVIRFFLWWKDAKDSRTDIDLSAVFFGDDYKYMDTVTYYNLAAYGCYHSGDITSAPYGACEFIDIDRKVLISKNVRYVSMNLYSYTEQPYCDLPECFAGWMPRKSAGKSGEIFEPKTVAQKIDLSTDALIAIPVVFDLVENQIIWMDMGLKHSHFGVNNVNTSKVSTEKLLQGFSTMKKANLYDLLAMHVQGRGILVNNKEEADLIFSETEGITPQDTEIIMAQYL